ncbi:MAG: thioredoxin [Acidimicrobiales bacterium]|nr:thioredoxin [Acidimicrobiales bacterium]
MSSSFDLPDGLVAVVKRDCATCELVAPLLAELAAADEPFVAFTQDDPTFPADADWVIDDIELGVSWHHDIETVPTLIKVTAGGETERIVGWDKARWQDFLGDRWKTIETVAAALPEFRPGCGSISVDPDKTAALAVKYDNASLASRRVEFAAAEDDIEAMFDRGWSDGLPLVPPTEARVMAMLEGTSRAGAEVVAIVPPNLAEATVEKVAINAVMAGCRPEYLPVVIAGLEAICTDEFNMHGVLATTMSVGPVFVVNGPIRHEIGMNSGINVLGHGNRANSTIGRAVQLVVRNVGGGAPGGVDRSTQGNPGKLGLCFAEDEEGSFWTSYAEERGFDPSVSTVTAYCGEGPRIIIDQLSRTPESLTRLLAKAMLATNSPRMAIGMDAMFVISPEHMARYRDADWDKARFREVLDEELMIDADSIQRGREGMAEGFPELPEGTRVPKFNPKTGLQIVHAGGPAGLFSSVIGGWLTGEGGSVPVTKEVRP